MRWTSAGHPPPLIQNLENNEAAPIGTDADCGLPLGIYPDVDYNSSVVPLKLNTRVLIYSDGLTDALPTNESPQFGVNGVVNSLRTTATKPLVEALDDLFRRSSDYTEGAGRHDDTSVVLVERSITGDESGNNQGNGSLR